MSRASRRSSGRGSTIQSNAGIEIVGLTDFTRALKVACEQAPKAMKEANYEVADLLVKAAKARARNEPGVAGKASRSLRASRTAAYASIRGGGGRYPYFYGAEFGSKRYGQFQSWRGNQWGGWNGGPGYFLHPAIRAEGPKAIEKYMEKIDALTAEAFPN